MARRPAPLTPRSFRCRCGQPLFFRNSRCLSCGAALGYHPARRQLWPLEPHADGMRWHRSGRLAGTAWMRCAHLDSPAACNWLVDRPGSPLCRCCRLTRVLPDLAQPANRMRWARIAASQRRLVSSLIALQLPVLARDGEDPARGLAFELRGAPPGGPPVVTGHADGVITLDVEEADDVRREQRRTALQERYRTLLGHLRHESGHYYWQRLVPGTAWLDGFRARFGDERADYAEALRRHHEAGPPAGWDQQYISAYASCHPWEDWAETWSHYLHLQDTLDTARSFGLDGSTVELELEPFAPAALEAPPEDRAAADFLALVNGWLVLVTALNELTRSMGQADFYPFVLSLPALRKLYFVHRVVAARGRAD